MRRAVAGLLIGVAALAGYIARPGAGSPVAQRSQLTNVDVVDGDTVRATIDGKRERIRIIGVDAPELSHENVAEECWSREASSALEDLVQGAAVLAVSVESVDDRDRYGRLLRQITIDGQDVGLALLEQGHARTFRALANDNLRRDYRESEQRAQAAKTGMWGRCPQND